MPEAIVDGQQLVPYTGPKFSEDLSSTDLQSAWASGRPLSSVGTPAVTYPAHQPTAVPYKPERRLTLDEQAEFTDVILKVTAAGAALFFVAVEPVMFLCGAVIGYAYNKEVSEKLEQLWADIVKHMPLVIGVIAIASVLAGGVAVLTVLAFGHGVVVGQLVYKHRDQFKAAPVSV